MRLVHTLFERGLRVGEIQFAPDGSALATTGGYRGNAIRLWDCADWNSRGALQGHRKSPLHFAFAGSARLLVSGAVDKQVKAWDCDELQPRAAHTRHDSAVTAVASSPDGARAVSGDMDGRLFSWNIKDFGTPVLLATVSGRVNSLAFSPGGQVLVSGGGIERQRSLVHILDSENGRLIKQLEGHSDWVLWVGFGKTGVLMATGSYGEICIWDTKSWKLLQVLKRPDRERFSTIAFSFSSHNDVFISGAWSHEEFRHESRDTSGKLLGWRVTHRGLVQLWDLGSGKLKASIEAHTDALCCLAYNLENDLLASGGADGVVKIWSLEPS